MSAVVKVSSPAPKLASKATSSSSLKARLPRAGVLEKLNVPVPTRSSVFRTPSLVAS